jgi:8-oxo-dGTP pyrophosphatase MutT (NUDIX family)
MSVKIVDNTIQSVKGIVYRKINGSVKYLVTYETDTGMVSFPGGAQDKADQTIEDTMKRELREELGLSADAYTLTPTDLTHEFVHTDKKNKARFGKKGVQHVFLVNYKGGEEIIISNDIGSVKFLARDQVLRELKNAYEYWIPLFTQAAKLVE